MGWAWKSLGGRITGAPGAVSRAGDKPGEGWITDVFARGLDDRLWQITWNRDYWTSWERHEDGFVLASSPGADSMAANHCHLFARGVDGQLWQKWFTDGVGWSGWQARGGQIKGAPAVITRRPDICDVFARGLDDRLWQVSWHGDHWTPWNRHEDGFVLASAPVARTGRYDMGGGAIGTVTYVAARGEDGAFWLKKQTLDEGWGPGIGGYNTGWGTWASQDGQIRDGPTFYYWSTLFRSVIEGYARGTDDKLWTRRLEAPPSPEVSPLHTWHKVPGADVQSLSSAPVATALRAPYVRIFARGPDGALWYLQESSWF